MLGLASQAAQQRPASRARPRRRPRQPSRASPPAPASQPRLPAPAPEAPAGALNHSDSKARAGSGLGIGCRQPRPFEAAAATRGPRRPLPARAAAALPGGAGRQRPAAPGCGTAAGSAVLGLLPFHNKLYGGLGVPSHGAPAPALRLPELRRARSTPLPPHKPRSRHGKESSPRARSPGLKESGKQREGTFSSFSRSPALLFMLPPQPAAAGGVLPPLLQQLPPAPPGPRPPGQLQLPARAAARTREAGGARTSCSPPRNREAALGPSPNYSSRQAAGPPAPGSGRVWLATAAVANGTLRGDIGLAGSCEYGGSSSSSGARRGEGGDTGAAQGDAVPRPEAGVSLRSGAGGGRCSPARGGSPAWGCAPAAAVPDR